MKVCCFTGSRPQNLPWQGEFDPRRQATIHSLKVAIWNAVKNEGYRHFISGFARGIDTIAAQLIIKLRSVKPELGITLEAAIPCKGQDRGWTDNEKAEYKLLCSQADKLTILSEVYTKTCMQERNKYMVDSSSLVIAVTDGRAGGTMNTIRYAKSKGKTVIVINP